ncbi:hypothetical protein RHGRI_019863 [Rhododendron griersonianum]|uniref:Uncharacterized protein n=1 Tax=Rhododendron griersonianum TaxID=479676 RepID=A0AAV6JE78_9ERIC|nr:hypothetical protein RHGRI_019863 [Rhododendron griersonianum]
MVACYYVAPFNSIRKQTHLRAALLFFTLCFRNQKSVYKSDSNVPNYSNQEGEDDTTRRQGKRHVTKQQIYLSLHQLLYQKASSDQITEIPSTLHGLDGVPVEQEWLAVAEEAAEPNRKKKRLRKNLLLKLLRRKAALARMHQMKTLSLRPEPEYGADVTQVKFPFCL